MTVEAAGQLLDRQLAAGRFPGYAVAVRHRGEWTVRTGGTVSVDDPRPVMPDTQFRIASLTKLVGGVLALGMVADGLIALADPVDRWLPELADRRVLRSPSAELTDTVPAERPIQLIDLLRCTTGLGLVLDRSPIQQAIVAAGLNPGPNHTEVGPDEYLARAGALPLVHQPGAGWLYHTSADLLGVLLSRVAGRPLPELLADRVTGPLGMAGTGFHSADPSRLTTAYLPLDAGLRVFDRPDGQYASPPVFASLGGGLVSTVADYARFLEVFDGDSRALAADSVRLMTTESPGVRDGVARLMGPDVSWGLCVGLDLAAREPWMAAGRFGWNGGSGSTAYVDPSRQLASVLLTPRLMRSATGDFDDFHRALAAGL